MLIHGAPAELDTRDEVSSGGEDKDPPVIDHTPRPVAPPASHTQTADDDWTTKDAGDSVPPA